MKTSPKTSLLTAALALCWAAPAAFAHDNPFAGMKGKVRDGQWEYKMQTDAVAGMPPGMSMPAFTFNQCITKESVEKGSFAQKDGKMPDGCTVRDMKYTGSSASWRMECVKDPKMTADVVMTFATDAFTMKQKILMDHGGQPMNMSNTMSGRYLGPCPK